MERLVQLKVL